MYFPSSQFASFRYFASYGHASLGSEKNSFVIMTSHDVDLHNNFSFLGSTLSNTNRKNTKKRSFNELSRLIIVGHLWMQTKLWSFSKTVCQVIRLLRFLRELYLLAKGIVGALRALTWAMFFLLLVSGLVSGLLLEHVAQKKSWSDLLRSLLLRWVVSWWSHFIRLLSDTTA